MKLVCISGNIPSGDGTEIGQGFSTQIHGGLDQLLRSIFPGEHIHVGDINFHGMGTSSAAVHAGATQSAATKMAAPREGDEGLFLSNLLRQIMLIISESTASGSSIPSSEGAGDIEDRTTQASSTQAQDNSNRGASSSSRHGNPPSSPSSKRQRVIASFF
ncbi:uncharacterized protein LOC114313704 [Camellia sinensis]|uniref:uncharacterized protein LOC114313704 n=1 Tax=Camellia sinensis TaxID=4442 RepID=UPI00103613E9|nr:uncharacterized protein LOC114313704 [Camellia sinensis]